MDQNHAGAVAHTRSAAFALALGALLGGFWRARVRLKRLLVTFAAVCAVLLSRTCRRISMMFLENYMRSCR